MKKNLMALIWSLGIGIPLVAIASGGYYLFNSENSKNTGVSATLSSASSKAELSRQAMQQSQTPIGQIFSGGGNTSGAFIPEAYIQAAYTADNEAIVGKTDALFKNPQTPDPKLNINIDTDVQAKIDSLRAKITDTLDAWRDMIRRIDTQGADQGSPTVVKQYADSVKEYIAELKAVVDNLTPGNSGLTPQEISADKAIVDAAVADANRAITIIDTAPVIQPSVQNDSDNQSVVPPVVAPDTNNDSSNQVVPVDQNVPPDQTFDTPPQDDSGPPRLIEGANRF